jgi:hypothetical protein
MFKYNVKSDLKNGKLVTPISATENDTIICLDENGNEIEVNFDDFDFEKTIDERYFVVEDSSSTEVAEEEPLSEIISEPEPEEIIETEIDEEDIIQEPKPEEIIVPAEDKEIITEEKSGFIENNSKKANILSSSGYSPERTIKHVNIWKDIVL